MHERSAHQASTPVMTFGLEREPRSRPTWRATGLPSSTVMNDAVSRLIFLDGKSDAEIAQALGFANDWVSG